VGELAGEAGVMDRRDEGPLVPWPVLIGAAVVALFSLVAIVWPPAPPVPPVESPVSLRVPVVTSIVGPATTAVPR
jgi:hypothetical protein